MPDILEIRQNRTGLVFVWVVATWKRVAFLVTRRTRWNHNRSSCSSEAATDPGDTTDVVVTGTQSRKKRSQENSRE